MPGTAWDLFDPATVPDAGGSSEPLAPQAVSPGPAAVSFIHPAHELFGFGALVGLTAVAMYLATEDRTEARGELRGRLGPAEGGIEADLGLDDDNRRDDK